MIKDAKIKKWITFVTGLLFLVLFSHRMSQGGDSASKIKVIHTSPINAEKLSHLDHVTVTITFNQNIDPTIQEDAVLDQRGAIDSEGNPIEVRGEISWPDPKTFKFIANEPLVPNATYQMSLFSVRTEKGEEWDEVPFRLVFTTGPEKKRRGNNEQNN